MSGEGTCAICANLGGLGERAMVRDDQRWPDARQFTMLRRLAVSDTLTAVPARLLRAAWSACCLEIPVHDEFRTPAH